MSKSKSSLADQADSTVEELKTLLREAQQALGEAGGAAGDQFQTLRERLGAALDDGRTQVKGLTAAARKQAARADEMVHENPYAAVGLAAGIGFIAGYLVCRNGANGR